MLATIINGKNERGTNWIQKPTSQITRNPYAYKKTYMEQPKKGKHAHKRT